MYKIWEEESLITESLVLKPSSVESGVLTHIFAGLKPIHQCFQDVCRRI